MSSFSDRKLVQSNRYLLHLLVPVSSLEEHVPLLVITNVCVCCSSSVLCRGVIITNNIRNLVCLYVRMTASLVVKWKRRRSKKKATSDGVTTSSGSVVFYTRCAYIWVRRHVSWENVFPPNHNILIKSIVKHHNICFFYVHTHFLLTSMPGLNQKHPG